jgi:hypothetical protein
MCQNCPFAFWPMPTLLVVLYDGWHKLAARGKSKKSERQRVKREGAWLFVLALFCSFAEGTELGQYKKEG